MNGDWSVARFATRFPHHYSPFTKVRPPGESGIWRATSILALAWRRHKKISEASKVDRPAWVSGSRDHRCAALLRTLKSPASESAALHERKRFTITAFVSTDPVTQRHWGVPAESIASGSEVV